MAGFKVGKCNRLICKIALIELSVSKLDKMKAINWKQAFIRLYV